MALQCRLPTLPWELCPRIRYAPCSQRQTQRDVSSYYPKRNAGNHKSNEQRHVHNFDKNRRAMLEVVGLHVLKHQFIRNVMVLHVNIIAFFHQGIHLGGRSDNSSSKNVSVQIDVLIPIERSSSKLMKLQWGDV